MYHTTRKYSILYQIPVYYSIKYYTNVKQYSAVQCNNKQYKYTTITYSTVYYIVIQYSISYFSANMHSLGHWNINLQINLKMIQYIIIYDYRIKKSIAILITPPEGWSPYSALNTYMINHIIGPLSKQWPFLINKYQPITVILTSNTKHP